MRTTITINDSLLEEAKRRADAMGLTLSALVELAVRRTLGEPASTPRSVPPLLVVGDPRAARVTDHDVVRYLEQEDTEPYQR